MSSAGWTGEWSQISGRPVETDHGDQPSRQRRLRDALPEVTLETVAT